jgi:hypothetical protein
MTKPGFTRRSADLRPAARRPWWLLPVGRVHPLWWTGLAGLLLWLDYRTGPDTPFPVAYVVPVCLAAWYSGRSTALALAISIPLAHAVLLVAVWERTAPLTASLAITAMRGAVIVIMGLWFARLSEHERALRQQVQTLEGLLPICAFCKKIRNDAGEWERLEKFISTRSDARFSHAYCPTCMKEQYPELDAGEAAPASPR